MQEIVLKIENLTKRFSEKPSPGRALVNALFPRWAKVASTFTAVSSVSFALSRGEVVGIIGHNGAGKSTLLKMISGVVPPTSGTMTVRSRVSAMLELGSVINPEYTGIENIYYYGAVLGLDRKTIKGLEKKIIEFADIGQHINRPVKFYSSGMKARLSFAIVTSIDPDILIVDEILSVGDAAFSAKSAARMRELIGSGAAALIVSHSVATMTSLCDRIVWLDEGKVVMDGSPSEVITQYSATMMMSSVARKKHLLDLLSTDGATQPRTERSPHNGKDKDASDRDDAKGDPPAATVVDNGGARITEVELVDAEERPTRQLSSGLPYTIKITAVIERVISDLSIGLSIRTRNGDVLAGQIHKLNNRRTPGFFILHAHL
ncbi:ABC transporter ATP-binding protein [Neoaquamicrobium sediminum]|uniref:ABC transporter ATP-binding protein n=1 Tax=Neoaquamicrobium sediminum TaxID=1849104 RepID=UPI001564A1B2|nr:ABC transporter ATP-binding protein [Mesorhizobium sediminum]NRC56215.1 ABC transporter ATP-binding protein [Mesorhizobium sediminum]